MQSNELKTFLNYTFGPTAYAELLQMEGQIRKDRQKAIYERQKLRHDIINYIAISLLVITIHAFLIFVLYLLKQKYGW